MMVPEMLGKGLIVYYGFDHRVSCGMGSGMNNGDRKI
jgi:hypothetical protein